MTSTRQQLHGWIQYLGIVWASTTTFLVPEEPDGSTACGLTTFSEWFVYAIDGVATVGQDGSTSGTQRSGPVKSFAETGSIPSTNVMVGSIYYSLIYE